MSDNPLFKILFEQHVAPLEGVELTRRQILTAQHRGDLGAVIVRNAEDKRVSVAVSGQWINFEGKGRWPMREQVKLFTTGQSEESLLGLIARLNGGDTP